MLEFSFSYVGHLIRQCRLLATEVGNIAHVLAQGTGSSPVLSVWDFIPPECISNLIPS